MTISEAITALREASKDSFSIECEVLASKYRNFEPQVEFIVWARKLDRSCKSDTLAGAVAEALAGLTGHPSGTMEDADELASAAAVIAEKG